MGHGKFGNLSAYKNKMDLREPKHNIQQKPYSEKVITLNYDFLPKNISNNHVADDFEITAVNFAYFSTATIVATLYSISQYSMNI